MSLTVRYALLLAVANDGTLIIQVTADNYTPYERCEEDSSAPKIVFVSLDDEMSIRLVDGIARSEHWVVASNEEDFFIDVYGEGMPTRVEITFNNLHP